RPANVGMAHSNQRNFLEHSEEPYNKYRYLRLIPNLQLTSTGRTGTATGPQIALGPHFAQVCTRASSSSSSSSELHTDTRASSSSSSSSSSELHTDTSTCTLCTCYP